MTLATQLETSIKKIDKIIIHLKQEVQNGEKAKEEIIARTEDRKKLEEAFNQVQNLASIKKTIAGIKISKTLRGQFIPRGYGKACIEKAIGMVNSLNRPVQTRDIVTSVGMEFDFGEFESKISEKRKHTCCHTALSGCEKLEKVGGEVGLWRLKNNA